MTREQSKIELEKEFDWFLDNQTKLIQKYDGKVLAIKGFNVIGAYDDYLKAINETLKTEELGTFIVQKCSVDPSSYVCVVNSGVMLNAC